MVCAAERAPPTRPGWIAAPGDAHVGAILLTRCALPDSAMRRDRPIFAIRADLGVPRNAGGGIPQ